MKIYAIGDLQGCANETELLLARIDADAGGAAHIVFVGDLVNRGPQSLAALRRVMALQQATAGRVDAVLGNHDLHLLAVAAGVQTLSKGDTLAEILDAPDRDALLHWLRHRPLATMAGGHLLVHAGVLPQWSVAQALALAAEVEQALRGDGWRDFLAAMYGNKPDRWDDTLAGMARLRCIVNAFTRMRLCRPDGSMDFNVKDSGTAPPGSNLMPWFALPNRRWAGTPVVFGHWSALGLVRQPDVIGLDSGCVWGGKLSAVCLDNRALLQVDCPSYRQPGLHA